MVRRFTRAWEYLAHPERSRLRRKLRKARVEGRAAQLSRDEFLVLFDRMTRRQLGMSAAEFLRRMDASELPDSDQAEYLALLAGGARTG